MTGKERVIRGLICRGSAVMICALLLCGFLPAGSAGTGAAGAATMHPAPSASYTSSAHFALAAAPAPSEPPATSASSVSSAPSAPEDSLRSPLYHYTEGIKRLYVRADTAGARKSFLKAIELDDGYAPACYELAVLAMSVDRSKAETYARKAHELDTTNRFYLGLYAQTLVYGMKVEPALEAYRKLTRLESANPDNYRMQALLSQHAGRTKEAVALLDSAEMLFGKNSHLGALKYRMLIDDGEYARALEEVQQAVEAAPYEPDNHRLLGEVYLAAGSDSLAGVALRRSLELDSTRIETLVSLADYYNRRRDYVNYFDISRRIFESDDLPLGEKVRIFNQFTGDVRFYREFYPQISTLARTLAVRYPRERSVVELYGRHLIASGEMEQALELYKMRLADEPPQLDYYTMVVDMESYLKRPDSADLYLTRAIELFPGRTELYVQQGHIASIYSKDFVRAVASYRKGLEFAATDSLRSTIWGYIGDVYQQQSQGDCSSTEEAFARRDNGRGSWKKYLKRCYDAYDRALKYDRDNVSVLNNYAYFLSLEGRDLNRALEMSSRVVALTDNNPTYLDTHAWVLFRLGRLDEAKRYLQQAVSLDGQKSPELQVHYGDVLAALGEYFMAETYWKRAKDNGYDPAEIERRMREMNNRKQ